MTSSSILSLALGGLLLSASLPVTAAPAQSTAAIATQMNAPRSAKALSPAERAKLYPALALLPSDVLDFIAISTADPFIKHLNDVDLKATATVPLMTGFQMLALGTEGVTSIAAASTAENIKGYSAFARLSSALGISGGQSVGKAVFSALGAEMGDENVPKLIKELEAQTLHPLYVVVSCKEGAADAVAAKIREHIDELDVDGAVASSHGEFKGVKFHAWDLVKDELGELKGSDAKTVRDFMLKRVVHLLVRQTDNDVVVALCEKPEEIKLAESAEASVLSAPFAAAMDGRGQTPLLFGHGSTELAALDQKKLWGGPAEIFEAMAKQITSTISSSPDTKATHAASHGASVIARFFRTKADAPVTQPSGIVAWRESEKVLRAEMTMDGQKSSHGKSQLRFSALADAPGTILYAESLPSTSGSKLPSFSIMFKSIAELLGNPASGGEDDDDSSGGGAVTSLLSGASDLSSTLASISGPVGTIVEEGMDDTLTLVIDNKGKMPASLGGKEKTPFPRLSLFTGIGKDSMLKTGWKNVEKRLSEKGSSVQDLIPYEAKTSAKVSCYFLSLPLLPEELAPNLVIKDKLMALGTDFNLNVAGLRAAGKGGTPFSGSVFVFHTQPLAVTLRGIARTVPKEASGLLENEEVPFIYKAAESAEELAKTVKSVYATTSFEKGLYTIRVRVDLP